MRNTAPPASPPGEESTRWLTMLERGLRPGEGARLRQWLKNPANRKSILETARVWNGPDVISVLRELIPNSAEVLNPRPPRRYLAMLITAAAAACIVASATIVLSGEPLEHFIDSSQHERLPLFSRTYLTAVGGRQEIKLEDNSTIMLNTGTRLSVNFSPTSRDVSIAYGEASFDVAQEPERPFNVRAGKRTFQAVGTRFNVRVLTRDNVELTVTEGAVKLHYAPPRLPDTPARRRDAITYGETTVGAFEAALVEPGFQSASRIEESDLETRLAWHRGMIVFDGDFLEDVLAEVDRYTTTKFVLADASLRDVRVRGHFRTGDVDGLLLALRQNFHINSRRDTRGRIVLTALATP